MGRRIIPMITSGHTPYGPPPFFIDGADFDGTNDWMTRGAGLSGAADSKRGIASVWYRIEGGTPTLVSQSFLRTDNLNGFFSSAGSSAARPRVILNNAAGTGILDIRTSGSYSSNIWRNALFSWDLAVAGSGRIYINDVSDYVETLFTNDTIDYTLTDWRVGADLTGAGLMNGPLAELYFAPGQYLDFSLVANRRKFISASGKPVYLGATGSLPTGVAPLVYHHLDDGEAVANFAINRGTGGNFTITGTLDTATTSPSD